LLLTSLEPVLHHLDFWLLKSWEEHKLHLLLLRAHDELSFENLEAKPWPHGQLLSNNTSDFKQNPPWLDQLPKIQRPYRNPFHALSQVYRENPDPDFTTSTDITGHSSTGLNLTGGNPGWLLSLETKLTKVEVVGGQTCIRPRCVCGI